MTAASLLLLLTSIVSSAPSNDNNDGWLYPLQRLGGYWLLDEDKFARYQSAERAIWRHAPHEFLIRRISSGYLFGEGFIGIEGITGNRQAGYERVFIGIARNDQQQWQVTKNLREKIGEGDAENAYKNLRAYILDAAHPDGALFVVNGLYLWECPKKIGSMANILQAYQIDYPSHSKKVERDFLKLMKDIRPFSEKQNEERGQAGEIDIHPSNNNSPPPCRTWSGENS